MERTVVENTEKYLRTSFFTTPATLHQFYRAHFNLVDLANGYFYQVEDHHGQHQWRSKQMFSILRFFIINIWSASSQVQPKMWKVFRESLAKKLIQTE